MKWWSRVWGVTATTKPDDIRRWLRHRVARSQESLETFGQDERYVVA